MKKLNPTVKLVFTWIVGMFLGLYLLLQGYLLLANGIIEIVIQIKSNNIFTWNVFLSAFESLVGLCLMVWLIVLFTVNVRNLKNKA